VRLASKEAGSGTASRRTETEYEAPPARVSGLTAAKPSRPKAECGVDSAVVRGKSCSYLGRSRFTPERATRREVGSEKSAEVVVAGLKGTAKDRMEGRAKRL